jgi:hypothetical protein
MGTIKNTIRTTLYISLLSSAGASMAADRENFSVTGETGLSLNSFNYRELDGSGNLIDKETGLLPGVRLGINAEHGGWHFGGQAEFQRARLDYDGQANTGRKLSTRTDESIWNAMLTAGKHFSINQANDFGMYANAGLRQWRRDIATVGNVSGLYENYRWWHVGLGGNAALYQSGKHRIDADVSVSRSFQPTLGVDFKGVYDKPDTIELPATTGWRVALPWRYQFGPATALRVETYLQAWNISRSAAARLTNNGVAAGSFFEPASETRLYGINAIWLQTF